MTDLTAEQLLAQEGFEEDVRQPPDNLRRGRFRAGWEDYTVRQRTYTPESLNQLTWTNLGYRMGMHFGVRARDEINTLYEMFAAQYATPQSSNGPGRPAQSSGRATYLLTWNPTLTPWYSLPDDIAELERKGSFVDTWSTGVTKKIKRGDRVFLMKLGKQPPQGIMASGIVISRRVFPGPHWDNKESAKGKTALYVRVRFDTILDPEKFIFPRARLDDPIYRGMIWEPRASGRAIPDDIAQKLERDWADFVRQAHRAGAGFGAPATNKKVEKAAIQFVTNQYKLQGWNVKSVEMDRCGFDLRCVKGTVEEHVEVKGIQGEVVSFITTSNEVQQAKNDKRFVLCVVTSAISKQPRLTRYSAGDFVKQFALEPLSFRAKLRL